LGLWCLNVLSQNFSFLHPTVSPGQNFHWTLQKFKASFDSRKNCQSQRKQFDSDGTLIRHCCRDTIHDFFFLECRTPGVTVCAPVDHTYHTKALCRKDDNPTDHQKGYGNPRWSILKISFQMSGLKRDL